jgi:hypothetical protein
MRLLFWRSVPFLLPEDLLEIIHRSTFYERCWLRIGKTLCRQKRIDRLVVDDMSRSIEVLKSIYSSELLGYDTFEEVLSVAIPQQMIVH